MLKINANRISCFSLFMSILLPIQAAALHEISWGRLLRGRHETFVHPLAEIRAEPLARQLSTELPFFAFFVDQGTCGGELNADTGVALVIDNLPVVPPPRMVSGKDLA